jgi:hypothetical protein
MRDKEKAGTVLDFNPEFLKALELMEKTNRHVFVTGRAGTGKSTLLGWFRQNTAKKAVVLAPTGVAAINVGGQTIHSFFGFKPDVTPSSIRRSKKNDKKNLFRSLTTIIIDEVSMVRADLLDCVDHFLRLNGPDDKAAFGGVQMIFIGDLYQLPPVVTSREKEIFKGHYATPYFFSAAAFDGLDMELVELEKVYRQMRAGRQSEKETNNDFSLALLSFYALMWASPARGTRVRVDAVVMTFLSFR